LGTVNIDISESRIVVQKGQSLQATWNGEKYYRRDITTLLNEESDISIHKYLFLITYAYAHCLAKPKFGDSRFTKSDLN
jgi:hypothetical protein